jgi:hypothetical protein
LRQLAGNEDADQHTPVGQRLQMLSAGTMRVLLASPSYLLLLLLQAGRLLSTAGYDAPADALPHEMLERQLCAHFAVPCS